MSAWYEMNGPGLDEVIEIVKNHKHFKDINMKKYNDLIEKVVQDEFIKYSGFGSYRGFYTFTLHTLVDNVEIAILNNWISKKEIKKSIKFYGNCDYSKYLQKLI